MAENLKFTSNQNGAVFAQPNGAVNDLSYLGCHEVSEVAIAKPDVDYGYCVNADGEFDVTHELLSPPPTQTATFSTLLGKERAWLEKLNCPPDLYILQRSCGKRDSVYNPDRVTHMPRARIITDTLQNPVSIDAPNKTMKAFAVKYANPHIVLAAYASRQTTTEATALRDIASWHEYKCTDACGKYKEDGTYVAAGASGAGGASANVQLTATGGVTWTAAAADPFGVGAAKHVIALVYVTLPSGLRRLIACKAAEAGVQGVTAYTDNGGGVWTTVNIGGAAAGHGATVPGGMYAIDNHVWIASAGGYIYHSDDYGASYTAQEGGTLFATAYTQIKFWDKNIGMAVTTLGNNVHTTNGGVNWAAGTAFSIANNNLSVEMIGSSMALVGNNAAKLWLTYDLGYTWEEIDWSAGAVTAGTLDNIKRAPENPACLWMLHNSVAPYGTIWRSWNWGATWDQQTDIDNDGLYGLDTIDSETVFIAGAVVNAGTAAIIKSTEKYAPV